MKNSLFILIISLAFISCGDKNLPGTSKENDLKKQKEFFKSLGLDSDRAAIDTPERINPDSASKFNAVGRAGNYFREMKRRRPANCFDTLEMLRRSPKEYDEYLKSLKERARQTPFDAIPGNNPDLESQELPPGYEYMIFKDSDLPDSLKIPFTIKKRK
ncbi:hypothetical protein [Pinibacter soli]|uniref:Lipoprotein n=1 Tax=Pinibacter soli TaxID=3044211 RepID=A0ABT6RCC5_9BACT|nr:hypothetical protein [Pinibacter soli]MDI3320224.1 hypothetical protein [Pinibacter soli]